MVYLAGKDDQGKTIYIEEEGTAHHHKTKEKNLQQPAVKKNNNSAITNLTESSSAAIKVINAKLDRIINLLVESRRTQEES
jgi:hypothetical protein